MHRALNTLVATLAGVLDRDVDQGFVKSSRVLDEFSRISFPFR